MSNPQTFYTVGGLDLSNIFQPLSLGSSALVTGYKFGNSHADLNTIFAAYPGSGPQASATGYKVGVNDLNTIFAKYNNNHVRFFDYSFIILCLGFNSLL